MDVYDRHLARQAAQGNKTAFGRLYDRHAPRVFNLLKRLARDTSAAEDLTQETFITAWESLGNWQGKGKLSTYFCGIAVNKYRAHYRKEEGLTANRYRSYFDQKGNLAESLEETIAAPTAQTDPFAHLTRKEAEHALEAAIADLPDACRDVFVLVRVEGFAYREAANLLQIPLGTVQSRLSRAAKLLQLALSDSVERSSLCPTPITSKL